MKYLIGFAVAMQCLVGLPVLAGSVDEMRPLSFVIKEGHVSTPLPLLAGTSSTDVAEDLRFEVSRGPGKFVETQSRRQLVTGRSGDVIVPSLRAGDLGQETFVSLRSEDRILLDDLRFVTIPTRLFDILHASVEPGQAGVYFRGDSMVVVDENLWVVSQPEIAYPEGFAVEIVVEDGFTLRSRASSSHEPGGPGEPLRDYPGGGDNDGEVDRCPSSNCYANPFPPGVVEWKMPDPIASGFSIKPESLSNALACPSPPKDGVDGVYRVQWGCGNALKIPDNCEADLWDDRGSCCCGVLLPLGYYCDYIDPRNNTNFPDWPDCYGLCVSVP